MGSDSTSACDNSDQRHLAPGLLLHLALCTGRRILLRLDHSADGQFNGRSTSLASRTVSAILEALDSHQLVSRLTAIAGMLEHPRIAIAAELQHAIEAEADTWQRGVTACSSF